MTDQEWLDRLLALPPIDLEAVAQQQREAKAKLLEKRDTEQLKLISELRQAGPECKYLLDIEIDSLMGRVSATPRCRL